MSSTSEGSGNIHRPMPHHIPEKRRPPHHNERLKSRNTFLRFRKATYLLCTWHTGWESDLEETPQYLVLSKNMCKNIRAELSLSVVQCLSMEISYRLEVREQFRACLFRASHGGVRLTSHFKDRLLKRKASLCNMKSLVVSTGGMNAV